MTYSSGGLIQAADFNNILGAASDTTGGGTQFNPVWATGFGNVGYGQTAVSNVAVGGTVTASSWADLVNKLNNARTHQTGAGSGISAPSAGSTITYLSTLTSSVSDAYGARLLASTTGTTTTGTNDTWNPNAAATSALSVFKDCNITFASADQARYFFNAGGKISYFISATDNAGTTRSTSLRDAINALGGIGSFGGYTNTGRTGTGGSISANVTTWGYWNNVLNSATTIIQSDDTNAAYSGYNCRIQAFTNSSDTTRGANGLQVTLRVLLTASADDAFGGNINLTVTSRCDIINPETGYLTNSWGTPTITYDYV